MSVEATALERSKLEQKDRNELSAIVSAMGGKAGSRARKADLVDQILRLAGLVPGAEPERPDRSGAKSGNGAEEGERAAPAAPSAAAAPNRPTAAPTPQVSGDARKSPAEVASDDAQAPAGVAEGTSAGAEGRDGEAEGRVARDDTSQPTAAPTGADASAPASQGDGSGGSAATVRQAPERSQPGQRQPGQQGQQGQRQGQGGLGGQGTMVDGDQGNRRRRRRGRRDRGPQEQQEEAFVGEPVEVEGFLDLRDDGYGFLRIRGFLPTKEDVYVSVKQVRQFGLRKGDHIKGASRPASRNEKNPALLRIDSVNGRDPEAARNRPRFEELTPLFPDEKLKLEREAEPQNMTTRIVDLLSPIGKGQRGLIVSPPKAGKTTIIKEIVRSIEVNNPEVHLIVLLTDERPEEVTDMRRWLLQGEVVASTFDRPSDEHTQVAELTIERARRMVELGRDVVIVLDGITRLARAYNLAAPATGRIMSGGVDSGALYPPKRFFGAARNIEEGGSLTILATALVETGS